MKPITGSALDDVALALGIYGSSGQQTQLHDDLVSQHLQVNELVRRGRTHAGTTGLYSTILQTVHGASGTLTASIDPYAAGALAVPPYPGVMPRDFDVWLLGATVQLVSGSPTAAFALLGVSNIVQGWGVDDSGAAVVANSPQYFGVWSALLTLTGIGTMLRDIGGHSFQRFAVRVPRQTSPGGAPEVVLTLNSNAASTWRCLLTLGVFPVALGQDAIA